MFTGFVPDLSTWQDELDSRWRWNTSSTEEHWRCCWIEGGPWIECWVTLDWILDVGQSAKEKRLIGVDEKSFWGLWRKGKFQFWWDLREVWPIWTASIRLDLFRSILQHTRVKRYVGRQRKRVRAGDTNGLLFDYQTDFEGESRCRICLKRLDINWLAYRYKQPQSHLTHGYQYSISPPSRRYKLLRIFTK